MAFLKYTQHNSLPFSAGSFKMWSRKLQSEGRSISAVAWAISGMKLVAAAMDRPISSKQMADCNRRMKLHDRSRKRAPDATTTYGISKEEALSLLNNPPRNVPPETWNNFVSLAWVFMLRTNEIKRVRPEHLTYVRGPQNKWGFQLQIKNNKNTVNKNENKFIFFPDSQIPREMRTVFIKFIKDNRDPWLDLVGDETIIKHLRKWVKCNDPNHKVVIHSFRHGRPKELIQSFGYTLVMIARVGRWHSTKAVRIYTHV